VADGQVLRIIRQWLTCGVMEEGRIRTEAMGTPQGGVISPLLANAYLNELDIRWKNERWIGRKVRLIRYADDLVALTDRDPKEPMEALRKHLSNLGLELQADKTRLVQAEKGSFDFLGFSFRKVWNRRRTGRFTLRMPSRKAELSIRGKVRKLTHYARTEKVEGVIREINPVIRGWVNYFRIGNSSRSFSKTQVYIAKKVMRYVRRKQLKSGFGWKVLPDKVLYDRWGLFRDYRLDKAALRLAY